MKPSRIAAAIALAVMASAAVAHQGVQNEHVLKRMDSMKAMGAALKVVGRMVRGQDDFDAAETARAVERLRAEAAATPTLFETRATDPRMEAVPELWDRWQDFVAKNDVLIERLAEPAPKTPEATQRWLAQVGRTCAACHEDYRQ